MPDVPLNTLNLPLLHLAGAFLTSTVYAFMLNTKTGRRWADEQTWATVVVGSALTLGWLAAFNLSAAVWALIFFAVTGIPIIIRSLALQIEKWEQTINRQIER